MKYMTLALIMIAPCLAQASQYVTGILSTSANGHHWIEVIVPESDVDDQTEAHDALEAPEAPEPCYNYNGVCKPPQPQPQPEPCGNYNGVCH